jgi:hypothetical protein
MIEVISLGDEIQLLALHQWQILGRGFQMICGGQNSLKQHLATPFIFE